MSDSVTTRILGGSPLTVLIRLGVVSLLVGALMTWVGIDAADLLYDLQRGLVHLYGTGFAALRDIGRTLVAGAAVVLPVWFVLRVLSYRGPRGRRVLDGWRGTAGFRPGAVPPEASRWSNPERRP